MATKSLKRGELILKEQPLAYAPGPVTEKVCFSCHKISTKPFICGKCTSSLCNKACQMSTEHQKECALLCRITGEEFKDLKPFKPSMLLLPLRCLLLRKEAPEKWKNFIQMESHSDIRQQTPAWSFVERRLVPYLKMMLHDQIADVTFGYIWSWWLHCFIFFYWPEEYLKILLCSCFRTAAKKNIFLIDRLHRQFCLFEENLVALDII